MRRIALSLVALAFATAARGQSPPADADTFFELKIRPTLATTCFPCHGGKKTSNGLRVDSRDALLRGGKHGPAVVPREPDKSPLVHAIRHTHDEFKMPPDKRLPDAVVADFESWVKRGAPWPMATAGRSAFDASRHWAFEPVRKSAVPEANDWSAHPIDRFVTARLREHGLKPAGPADKRVLLRRVYFGLTGLPPRPDEVDAFLADGSPAAFANVVERLLASPHYGERWGRHWLDVARYADTAGDNADYPVPEARLYRDYVIDAFNADKPYDEFVREQIAGDILAKQGPRERYAERVIATGFLALSRRYATAPYELWPLTLEDAIETTGRAFLGLTLRCARCHDHKFDPVTQEDYYALYGIFASTQFPWAGAEEFASKKFPREHFVPLVPPQEAAPVLASFQQRIRELEAAVQALEKTGPPKERRPELDRMHAALFNFRRRGLPDELACAYAVQDGKPVDAPIHLRGDDHQPGPVVPRNVVKFLSGGKPIPIARGGSGRLELARWLTDPKNPLTARVMANRIWQHHFGKGLVPTPSNFGLRGEAPTHRELLDWLAARFVESGWSVKAMHRLILSSKTYQLASSDDDANAASDPGNLWYWRFDRRRLDAEALRDAMLAVSGALDASRPGPHPFPPIQKWGWTQHNPFKDVYPTRHRSVYLMTQRFQRHPYLALFDGPDTNTTTPRRATSTVPLQALFLMNNPFAREQAENFGRRLARAAPEPRGRIDLAYRLAWSRPPEPGEIERAVCYLRDYEKLAAASGVPSDRREPDAWTSLARVLLSANEFFYVD